MKDYLSIEVGKLLALAALVAPLGAFAEEQESKDGRKIEATIVSVSDEEVAFRRSGSEKVYKLPLTSFSEATVEMLEDWEAPPASSKSTTKDKMPSLEIKFFSGKGNRLSKNERFDDRTERIDPNVTVRNRDLLRDLANVKMTVVTFARGVVANRQVKVLAKNTFDVSIAATNEADFKCTGATYDFYKKAFAKYGFKYQGYAIVLHDEDGNVLLAKSSPEGYAKIPERVIKVQAKKTYDMKLYQAPS